MRGLYLSTEGVKNIIDWLFFRILNMEERK